MRRVPPGRAARLWLRRRLDLAARGIDVLEEKAHVLTREQRRLRQHVEETERNWVDACREADRWSLRAVALGGRQQFDLARSHLPEPAQARISWRSLMGVTYPAKVQLRTPETGHIGSLARSSALPAAADAYRRALAAALDHAAATRSLELVEHELAQTRRRLRGLENRWAPRLERTLHEVELSIAEDEREDMVRARWSAERNRRTRR